MNCRAVLLLALLSLTACSGAKPAELLETAKFEELQNNRAHAQQLYQEIIDKYPGSEEAKKAQQRLAQLQSGK